MSENEEIVPENGTINPDKKYGELIQRQVEFNYMNFDRRRSYEWKLSLALWTVLVALVALSLRGEIQIETIGSLKTVMVILSVSVLVIQFYFLSMILGANKLDKQKSWYYEKALNILLHTDYETQQDPHSEELRSQIKKLRGSLWRMKGYWSCFVEIVITLLLLFIIFFVLKGKLPAENKATENKATPPPISKSSTE